MCIDKPFALQVIASITAINNFWNDLLYATSQNAFISPIVMGSPFSFVNEYAAYILGNETMLNLSQVALQFTIEYCLVCSV